MALLDFSTSPWGGKIRLLHPENENEPGIRPTVVILHTIVGDAQGAAAYFDDDSVPLESHFVVAGKWFQAAWPDGYVVQLMDTAKQADANYKANSYAISIETEDDGSPENTPWTPKQIDSIVWLLKEITRIHGIPRVLVAKGDCAGPGIGYHSMHGAPSCWTNAAGKTCPGTARIAQIPEIIKRLKGDDMSLSSADKAFISAQSRFVARWVDHGDNERPGTGNNLKVVRGDLAAISGKLDQLLARQALTPEQVADLGAALAAAVNANVDCDVDEAALGAALADELATRLVS